MAIVVFLMFTMSISGAEYLDNIEYAKKHLIILVHGIGDDHACFDKVKAYLEGQGLAGYVFAYEFSDPFLNIEKEGWEFGDRGHDNPEAVSKDSDT
ncbi:hypothetical protein HZC35_03380 [Candidatus Saganbacteria bacterium]|nr:hypothetical protein [Candidatus Saganbacteria bacterium]